MFGLGVCCFCGVICVSVSFWVVVFVEVLWSYCCSCVGCSLVEFLGFWLSWVVLGVAMLFSC